MDGDSGLDGLRCRQLLHRYFRCHAEDAQAVRAGRRRVRPRGEGARQGLPDDPDARRRDDPRPDAQRPARHCRSERRDGRREEARRSSSHRHQHPGAAALARRAGGADPIRHPRRLREGRRQDRPDRDRGERRRRRARGSTRRAVRRRLVRQEVRRQARRRTSGRRNSSRSRSPCSSCCWPSARCSRPASRCCSG